MMGGESVDTDITRKVAPVEKIAIKGNAVTENSSTKRQVLPNLRRLTHILFSETNTFSASEAVALTDSENFRKNLEKVQIIAHKAGGGEAPEGTIEAMENALRNGTHWLDVDVRMTKRESDSEGGTLVISHSPRAEDIDKQSGVKDGIPNLTLLQVKQLDAGYNFTTNGKDFPYRDKGLTVPTLEEAMKKFPNARFTIHLLGQNEGIEEELVKVIMESDAYNRVFVSGFSDDQLNKVKELSDKKIQIGAGAMATIEFLDSIKSGNIPSSVPFDFFTPGGEEAQSEILYEVYGAKFLDWVRREKFLDMDYIAACKELGIPFYVWTVNGEDEMIRWISLGVDGIYTDFPSQLNNLKKKYHREPKGFVEEFARNLVYGLSDFVIVKAAADKLDWESHMPTPNEVAAEVKRMEFVLMKGEKRAEISEIKNRLQKAADMMFQEDAPELDSKLEDVLIRAEEKLDRKPYL